MRHAQFPFTMSLMFQSRGCKRSLLHSLLTEFTPSAPFISGTHRGLMLLFCAAERRTERKSPSLELSLCVCVCMCMRVCSILPSRLSVSLRVCVHHDVPTLHGRTVEYRSWITPICVLSSFVHVEHIVKESQCICM